ncbi:Hypothetical predicted protein [Podarcis lilfordi]|uniref:Uncharacterized protein n=1 Tax=Podarcis lilfordi TaxID=74358 RepID=A0AA35K7M6_9SAUR|nr:Hypothetical predicted protein [Podarcis lilfordi]
MIPAATFERALLKSPNSLWPPECIGVQLPWIIKCAPELNPSTAVGLATSCQHEKQ